ncbi:MAG TPA: hypothetical protein VHS78_13540 [Candidatus Elarobacter sp.]|nr:hypothetical protein [Candidatus Elarobacter sp.]
MPQIATATRHRSADAAVGYAADRTGNGIAYVAIATGTGRAVVKVPFSAVPLAALDGREFGYAAVAAAGAYLRSRGFTRVRIRVADEIVADDLNGRRTVPPALAMAYVKTRCILHGFAVARIERGEPVETHDLETRARAEIALRTPAAA